MYKCTFVALLFLFGCEGAVYPKQLRKVEDFCKEHNGWAEIVFTSIFRQLEARCADGTSVSWETLHK